MTLFRNLLARLSSWADSWQPIQDVLDQPACPAQVVDYYVAHLEASAPTVEAELAQRLTRRYLAALAGYCTGEPGRPACTVANVLALAKFPDYQLLVFELVGQQLPINALSSYYLEKLCEGSTTYTMDLLYSRPNMGGPAAPLVLLLRECVYNDTRLTQEEFLQALQESALPPSFSSVPSHSQLQRRGVAKMACQRYGLAKIAAQLIPALQDYAPTPRARKATSGLRKKVTATPLITFHQWNQDRKTFLR